MTQPENPHNVIKALEAKLQVVARERSESVAELSALEAKLQVVARERSESVAELRALEARLQVVARERSENAAALRAMEGKLEVVARERRESVAALGALNAKLKVVARERRESVAALRALNAKLEVVARERRESVAALHALSAKLEVVARERGESVAALQALNAKLQVVVQERSESVVALQALNAKLQVVVQERDESFAALKALAAKMEIVAEERSESVAALHALVDEQTRTFVELSELRQRLNHFESLKSQGRPIELDSAVRPKVRRRSAKGAGTAPTPKILFDHIPKCAGTSIRSLLMQLRGPDRVAPFVQAVSAGNASRFFAWYDVVTGHFYGRIFPDVPEGVRVFTVAREPVSRVLSYFFYMKQMASQAAAPEAAIIAAMSLNEFIRSNSQSLGAIASNFMTNHFADAVGAVRRPGDLLPMAREAVDRYAFVGLAEEPEATARRICELCEAPPHTLPQLNTTAERAGIEEIDPAILEAIRDRNTLDAELYELIRERFHSPAPVVNRPAGEPPGAAASFGSGEIRIEAVRLEGELSGTDVVSSGETLAIGFTLVSAIQEDDLILTLIVQDMFGEIVYWTSTQLLGQIWHIGPAQRLEASIRIRVSLGFGSYSVSLAAQGAHDLANRNFYHFADNAARFAVRGNQGPVFYGYTDLAASIDRRD